MSRQITTSELQNENAYFYQKHFANEGHISSDAELLNNRMATLNKYDGLRVGDFVRLKDGRITRVAYHWGDAVQPASGNCGRSYYLGNGYVSFSGGLDPSIPVERFKLTTETRQGYVWIFHRDRPGAGCGVSAKPEFRVFEEI